MGLEQYRAKRNFKVTAEPRGRRSAKRNELSFVIQKHDASHLHYEFRLELDGVLKSWAVPKGPSVDPSVKRLAMQVEDHPLEYGDFEGIIPQGEYGGGTVLLWDRGTWEPVEDGRKGYRDGALKFVLNGEKLQGRWMLVRRGGKRGDPNERTWFLFKERDRFSKTRGDVTTAKPLSVATGRNLDEIAAQADRVWGSNGRSSTKGHASTSRGGAKRSSRKSAKGTTMASARAKKTAATSRASIASALKAVHAKRSRLPTKASVQLATLVSAAPEGEEWFHEIKFDGYRMLCWVDQGKVRFVSRNGHDWTAKFPGLPEVMSLLPVGNAIFDGEVVVEQPDGTTSFQALQNAFQSGRTATFVFYVFDLLHLDGYDVRDVPLEDRKELLKTVVRGSANATLKYSDHIVGNGPRFFAEASRRHLEGIVSKRRDRPYSAGRSLDWLKVKCSLREEFVIGGFTPPSGSRRHFGALLLGYYDRDHKLRYAGRVGTGFDDRTLDEVHKKLTRLVRKSSPFVDLSGHTGQARGVSWVAPTLVGQITFSNWTDDKHLRHPSFQGLREDKAATEIVRDVPLSAPAADSSQEAANLGKRTALRNTSLTKKREKSVEADSENEIAGVKLSHPDKLLYPDDGITKLDLARYYEQVAPWMLPHVANRLLSLVRCPAGVSGKCFFQKHPSDGMPEHFRRFKVKEKDEVDEYLALDDVAGLVSLVQMGVLEIHTWGSTADRFEKPDRLVFDLDPDPTVEWPQVVSAAKEIRTLLEELGLVSFVKTTGGKGLHVVVPIQRRTSWDDAKAFCRAIADTVTAVAPDRYIATMSKAARKGKIFIDYLRNDRGATAIAPYSTRAKAGATVSVPIAWEELSGRLRSNHFNIRNLPTRLSGLKQDPWADLPRTHQSITASMLHKLKSR